MTVFRRERVLVVGSGQAGHGYQRFAQCLGYLLAQRQVHLLTGGGQGIMSDVAEGFCAYSERLGLSIGVLPRNAEDTGARAGYPNEWIDLPIFTHLRNEQGPESRSSRNWINVLSASRLLIFPGRAGTLAECQLSCQWTEVPRVALFDERRISGPDRDFAESVEALGIACLSLNAEILPSEWAEGARVLAAWSELRDFLPD